MTKEKLIEYLITACDFLGIKLTKQSESEFHLTIPDELTEHFNNEKEFDITFNKDIADHNRSYITTESFLIQKIAKLTADKGCGVTVGEISTESDVTAEKITEMFCDCKIDKFEVSTIPADFMIVTAKITMRLNKIEEFIHCYKLDIKSGECTEIPVPDAEYITNISTIGMPEYNREKIENLYLVIQPHITDTVETHYNEKQCEYLDLCSKETERINEYYDLLIKENETSSDKDTQESINLLNLERDNLIKEQNKKFSISKSSVSVEPVSVCLIRENGTKASVKLSNKYGSVALSISSLREIKSLYGENTVLPLTITSENHICNAQDTFFCTDCGKKHYKGNVQKCTLCNKIVCKECNNTSPVSGVTICREHTHKCTNCGAVVAENEVFICQQCGKEFCYSCNHAQRCHTCNIILCDSCKTVSATSGKTYCKKHTTHCTACNSPVGHNELAICNSCSVSYCTKCTNGKICKICSNLKPADHKGMEIVRLLSSFNLKASSFMYNTSGNIAVVKGKKMFGSFIAVIDLRSNRLLSKTEYNMFGNKKQG